MFHEFLNGRSTLYNIEPIGVGAGHVESLTSYLMRIAFSHNVAVGTLMNKLIIPEMGKEYLKRSSTGGGNRLYDAARSLNAYSEISFELVQVMEKLTSRNDLSNLTLTRWKEFIPQRNLLRDSLAWCPVCIQEMRELESSIFYPLIWNIKIVEICIKHQRILRDSCHACNKNIEILRRNSIPGYCPHCFASLDIDTQEEILLDQQELKWQEFVIQNIEDLLTMDKSSFESSKINKHEILNLLNQIFEKRFLGNISHFSQYLNVPKTTLRYWLNGENFPTLGNLLKIFFEFNKKISELLFKTDISPDIVSEIKEQDITNHEKSSRRQLDHEAIKEQLNELLLVNPPMSMVAAAKMIGRDKRILYSNFPNICKEISTRYRKFVKNKSSKRVEILKNEIDAAINSLIKDGVYPSRRQVEKVTNKSGLLKEKVLQDHWKARLIENCNVFEKQGGI